MAHIKQIALSAPFPRGSRGRNGVFTATRVQLYARPADPACWEAAPAFVSLNVLSMREGKLAPVSVGLSPEDALLVGTELVRAAGLALGYTAEQLAALQAGDAEALRACDNGQEQAVALNDPTIAAECAHDRARRGCPECGNNISYIPRGTCDERCARCGALWPDAPEALPDAPAR